MVSAIGKLIRAKTIGKTDLTVTDLSNKLGIGRPALSNVLNGNASLSIELALTLEEVFGLNARQLLIKQLDEDIDAARASASRDQTV